MKRTKALIVVDLQRDFCPGGALAVPEGDKIIPVINDLLKKFDLIIFTKDWHPEHHIGFASSHEGYNPFDSFEGDTLWPDHCIENTPGSELHSDVKLSNCKKDFYFFKKGLSNDSQGYSGFENTGLREFLDERNVTETYICGLALDYCVKNTAIDAAMAGYDTYVIKDACKSISSNLTNVLAEFEEAGIYYLDSWAIEFINNI